MFGCVEHLVDVGNGCETIDFDLRDVLLSEDLISDCPLHIYTLPS